MLERCGMCDDWLVFLNLPRLPMTRFFVWIWFRKEDDMIWSGYKVLFGLPLGFLFFIGPRRLGLVGMLLGLVWLVFVMWPMDFTLLPRRATLVAVQGGGRWATLNYPPWMFWMQLQLETDLGFCFDFDSVLFCIHLCVSRFLVFIIYSLLIQNKAIVCIWQWASVCVKHS